MTFDGFSRLKSDGMMACFVANQAKEMMIDDAESRQNGHKEGGGVRMTVTGWPVVSLAGGCLGGGSTIEEDGIERQQGMEEGETVIVGLIWIFPIMGRCLVVFRP